MTKQNQKLPGNGDIGRSAAGAGGLHPSWIVFIRHCQQLGFGEISQLKIQDGVPVMAEEITRKIKFS
jgi:hypothetical protein